MFRSRWFYILAAFALGFALLATIGYYRIQEAQTDPYPDARHQPARNATEPVLAENQKLVPPAYDPHCQAPKDREDSDLCAQWSAVEAMKESNRVTQVALRAGWFEFVALLISIFFTGWAAIAAGRAAKFAEVATKGADEALKIATRNADAAAELARVSRETARQQLRAYISFEDGMISEVTAGKEVRVNFGFKNAGHTPAFTYAAGAAINLVAVPITETPLVDPKEKQTPSSEGPGSIFSHSIATGRVLTAEEAAAFHAGGRAFVASCEIRYTDIFGEKRRTLVTVYRTADSAPLMNQVSVLEFGNDAT